MFWSNALSLSRSSAESDASGAKREAPTFSQYECHGYRAHEQAGAGRASMPER
jgi:hypothetical protein